MARSVGQNQKAAVIYSVFFLFFFQLIADFVEAIYAFGLLGTSIPPEIVSVLFLFSPIVLLFWRQGMGDRPFLFLSLFIFLSRLVEVLLDTRGRMIVSGLGVAAWFIWFPALLWRSSRREHGGAGALVFGLMGGVALSVLFRVLGSGFDLSTQGSWQAVGWLLALGTAVLLLRRQSNHQLPNYPITNHDAPFFPRLLPPTLGLTSVFILLYFIFTSPNVMARWTGANYPAIVILLVLALAGSAALMAIRPVWFGRLRPGAIWAGNGLFVLALLAAIWPYQIHFPADLGSYPLYETAVSPVYHLPLYLLILLCPIIFIDFRLFAQALLAQRPSLPALGGAFTLASLYFLIMIFAHVFTTVYDYIPVVGPFFRDKFWLVHLIPGLGLGLPLLATRREDRTARLSAGGGELVIALLALGILAVAGLRLTAARPATAPAKTAVRVLTYNIQQGYNQQGQRNFNGQLELIRSLNADIIGLQETDTNRLAGGNGDIVRALANALDMYAYYGPKTIPGTFGIVLLSRFPIQNPRTFYMYSAGEQTATIEAQILVGGRVFNVFVTHLGNGGPLVQQEAIMRVVTGQENIILMGDFNFRPDSEPYRMTTAVLDDAWLLKWPDGVDDQGLEPADRIDHIFVSPGIEVLDAHYLIRPASDHPAVLAEIK